MRTQEKSRKISSTSNRFQSPVGDPWVKPVFSGWDRVGTLISKFEYKSWDIDIKNITVSHCDHTKCITIFIHRLQYYQKRKNYLEGMLEAEALKLSNQARFILEKCDGSLVVENKKKKVMVEELQRRGFDSDPVKKWKKGQVCRHVNHQSSL